MAKELYTKDETELGANGSDSSLVYYPSLLIGLGGTGVQSLLRVKKLLREEFPEGYHLHRFLFIDTDTKSFSKMAGLPEIEPAEQCLIGFNNVENLLHDPELYPQIWERFPKSKLTERYIRLLAVGNGASQIRALGALALALDYRTVTNHMKQAHDDLVELKNKISTQSKERGAFISNSVTPYLVGSLAGGTGSGCFMDVAVIAKTICGGVKGRLSGFFALPGAFDLKFPDPDMIRNVRANTYAALKELQFSLDAGSEERKKIGTINFNYDTGKTAYTLSPEDRLFTLCHVIDDRNEMGKISTMEDLYTLMARSIFQEIGTSFGGSKKAWESNVTVLNSIEKCRKSGKDRVLGTVSTAALVFPAERVAMYCSFRRAAAVISECILGTSLKPDQLRGKVSSFLSKAGLDERGSSNQIVDALLSEGEVVKSPADYGISRSFGRNKDAAEFVSAVRDKWSQFHSVELPKLNPLVETNRRKILDIESGMPGDNILQRVLDFSVETGADMGVRASRDMLEDLERVGLEMKAQTEKKISDWREQKESYVQEFNRLCDKLQRMNKPLQILTNRDEKLKNQVIDLLTDFIQQSLSAVARTAALEVLAQLITKTQEIRNKWDVLNNRMKELLEQSNKNATRLESEKKERLVTNLAFELEVTKPGYESRYYDSAMKARKATDDLAVIVKDSGNRRDDLYRSLLGATGLTELGNKVGMPLYKNIAPVLFTTNIIEFIRDHPDEISVENQKDGLRRLLDIAKDVCRPFWIARPVGDADFKEYWAISLKPLETGKGPARYPDDIEKWAKPYKFDFIPHDAPYEIILSQRTYGARAFYIKQCEDWKTIYESRKKEFGKSFMLESHTAFEKIPDLFPASEDLPLRYFGLGMALGFVVKRGDWYYVALEKEKDENGADTIRVLYKSEKKDWQTVHTLSDEVVSPQRVGLLDFSNMKAQVDKDKHMLAQGREKASKALGGRPDAMELINRGIAEYHSERGTSLLKQQLTAYCKKVLDPLSKSEDIFSKEKEAIQDFVIGIGQ